MVAEDDPMDLGNEALQKGASYFIRKPLTPMVVSNLLKHIVPKTWGIPDVTSTIPKNKGFTWSYQGNDKQKKIQNTQYGVTSIGDSVLHNDSRHNKSRMIYTSSTILSTNIFEILISPLSD